MSRAAVCGSGMLWEELAELQGGRRMEMPAPGCSLPLSEPCSPWGSAAQGLYQGWLLPCAPHWPRPKQPWLSAPAIPSTLALSSSGCFLMQAPPFTPASLKNPFPPLSCSQGSREEAAEGKSPFQPQTLPWLLFCQGELQTLGSGCSLRSWNHKMVCGKDLKAHPVPFPESRDTLH